MKKSEHRNTIFSLPHRSKVPRVVALLFLILPFHLYCQQIRIDAEQEPLNSVLIELSDAYGIQLSFDDRLLSEYRVTLHRQFASPEEAISALLDPFPLAYQKNGEVYVIFKQKDLQEEETFTYSGRVIDVSSGEALPYSHLTIGRHGMVSDASGRFTVTSIRIPRAEARISHLGYYLMDTVIRAGRDHVLPLSPSRIRLKEVSVAGRQVERSGQVGETAGTFRLNHQVAYRIPGNGDDALFHFLRLQPGILASGEQSSEMIIWGGYAGHSQLIFDGFTIFGPKNFNDNISFVNPFMAKEIRVLKGGYPARYGNRVGGIVEITGTNGNRKKPVLNLNINNMTVSGMAGIPVGGNAAVTLAFRHTYYNLYDGEDLGLQTERRGNQPGNAVDITVRPDYLFRDVHVKYAGSTAGGDPYYVSLYRGGDRFSYSVAEEKNVIRVQQEAGELSRQLGGTLYYGTSWENGLVSNFSLSYSGRHREITESREMYHKMQARTLSVTETAYQSSIEEVTFTGENDFSFSETHRMSGGGGYTWNRMTLLQDSVRIISGEVPHQASRAYLFAHDVIRPFTWLTLEPGIRMELPFHLQRVFFQPRFRFSLDFADHWKFNGAWGIYHQFIAETSTIDEFGNYRYFWAVCDEGAVPVLRAHHVVGGVIFQRKSMTLSLEPFYKPVRGLTRLVETSVGDRKSFTGHGRSYGMDLYIKKQFGKHEGWISYTLSKAEEYFPYFPSAEYAAAPQDQRHEIKGAVLLDFRPFFFSANYVYGSGLAYGDPADPYLPERYPYSRLDAAIIYRRSIRRAGLESGISVLNILNRENIKYTNLVVIPDGQESTLRIHAEAVPFTPALYLKLSF